MTNLLILLLILSASLVFGEIISLIKLKKIAKTEKHFRSMVNLSPLPLILTNQEGEIAFTSKSLLPFLNLKKDLPKTIPEIIHPEDIYIFNIFTQKILEFPNSPRSIEIRLKKNNEWIWVRFDVINLLKKKHVNAIVSTVQDITIKKDVDREKAALFEKEKFQRAIAENAIRDRDEFLSIASHELKTPLTTVLLQLQATLRKISTQSLADFSGAELMNSLQIAEKQSQSLSTLIKDLLNVSIASTGRLTLNKERVNLSHLVKSLVKRFQEEIKLSGSNFVLVIKDEEVIGLWDPVRVEQAISNLLTNALKYAKGKDITLTVKKESNWGILKIEDKGEGIEQRYHKAIFEPFRRATNNSNAKGLGVGLFITKHIATTHSGDIDVKSELGKGSIFTLKLPLEGQAHHKYQNTDQNNRRT